MNKSKLLMFYYIFGITVFNEIIFLYPRLSYIQFYQSMQSKLIPDIFVYIDTNQLIIQVHLYFQNEITKYIHAIF